VIGGWWCQIPSSRDSRKDPALLLRSDYSTSVIAALVTHSDRQFGIDRLLFICESSGIICVFQLSIDTGGGVLYPNGAATGDAFRFRVAFSGICPRSGDRHTKRIYCGSRGTHELGDAESGVIRRYAMKVGIMFVPLVGFNATRASELMCRDDYRAAGCKWRISIRVGMLFEGSGRINQAPGWRFFLLEGHFRYSERVVVKQWMGIHRAWILDAVSMEFNVFSHSTCSFSSLRSHSMSCCFAKVVFRGRCLPQRPCIANRAEGERSPPSTALREKMSLSGPCSSNSVVLEAQASVLLGEECK